MSLMAKQAKPAKKSSKPAKKKPAAKAKAKPVAARAKPKARPAAKAPARPALPRAKWFDDASSAPVIEEQARRLTTFMTALADGKVEAHEVKEQEQRLVAAMKEADAALDNAAHAKVTQLLCELTAYDLMNMLYALEQARPKTTFHG